MQNTKKIFLKRAHILSTLILISILAYIIGVYKTVILASDLELNQKKMNILISQINQKEYDYIRNISSIDLDKASSLGYYKNIDNNISYFNIKDNSFALR